MVKAAEQTDVGHGRLGHACNASKNTCWETKAENNAYKRVDRQEKWAASLARFQAWEAKQGVSVLIGGAENNEVDAWLSKISLSEYASQIKQYGYDQMPALYKATEADIIEMTEDGTVGMKKPHRRVFLAKWKELLASAAPPAANSPGPA